MILAGDIGGTKTNLAYFEQRGETLVPLLIESYPSQSYPSLLDVIAVLQHEHPQRITAAAFGIAGPVVENRCRLTNISWVVDGDEVARSLGLPAVGLLNDLVATAYGLLRLEKKDIRTLQEGKPVRHGAIGVIAAGTGLGGCALVWNGSTYLAIPSEGGHADFAPRNQVEADLMLFLRNSYEHVGVERVVAGPGIHNIYRFLRSRADAPEPGWLTSALMTGDPSAVISQAALEEKDAICEQTLDIFTSAYGSEAGNIALRFLATGGMYVAGGIAPKILSKIEEGAFLESFLSKDTYRPLLQSMPFHVVLNEKTALLGAAHYAATMQP